MDEKDLGEKSVSTEKERKKVWLGLALAALLSVGSMLIGVFLRPITVSTIITFALELLVMVGLGLWYRRYNKQ